MHTSRLYLRSFTTRMARPLSGSRSGGRERDPLLFTGAVQKCAKGRQRRQGLLCVTYV